MSFTTLLINDSVGTIVATLTTNVVSLVKDVNRLLYNVAPPGTPPSFEVVNRIVSAASRVEATTSALVIGIVDGTSWVINSTQCNVISPRMNGGLSWSYNNGTSTLDIVAGYPDTPNAVDINGSPGIYWLVEGTDAPAVKLKVHVKRLTT